MKYVRSIGLFFVYPMLCLVLGLFVGETFSVKESSDNPMADVREEILTTSPPVIIYDEGDALPVETVEENQNVMNPDVISQLEDSGAEKGYFVALYNDYVVVYYGDKETIYLFTDMKSIEFPEEVQCDLVDGMYMKDEGELYDFLENYTS